MRLLDRLRRLLGVRALAGCVAAAALLVAAPVRAQLVEAAEGEHSAVAARYQFGSTGGDWAVPADAPQPLVDCRGDFRDGSCGATQFTASGSPGTAPTYWRHDGGATGVGVAFDGVDDYLDAGDAGDQAGDFTICTVFNTDTIAASTGYIVSKDSSAGRSFYLRRGTSSLIFSVYKGDASGSPTSIGTISAGIPTVACVAYDFVADGASIIRANVNGVAPSETNNAVGPPQPSALPLRIGASSAIPADAFFKGSISNVTLWTGWAASASDLARMVRAQQAHQGSLGETLTVSRASTESVELTDSSGAPYAATVPANTLAIGPRGAQGYGAFTQSVTYPNDPTQSAWIREAGVSVAKNSDACPVGPDGARMHLLTTAADKGAYQSWSHAAAQYTLSVWAARASEDADCTADVRFAFQPAAGSKTLSLTASPVRHSLTGSTAAGNAGIYLSTRAANTCTRFCFWGANETNTAFVAPFVDAGALPLSVPGTAVSLPHLIRDPNNWCIRIRKTASGALRGVQRGVFSMGSAPPNHVYFEHNSNGYTYVMLRGADGLDRYVYSNAAVSDGEHAWLACNARGTPRLYLDGVAVGALFGSGTGLLSELPASLDLRVGASFFNGFVNEIVTCNTSIPEDCR